MAFDLEEHTLGICAAGVVTRDLSGNDIAISVPVPTQRFHKQQKLIAERLIATRRALGRSISLRRRRDALTRDHRHCSSSATIMAASPPLAHGARPDV